MRPKLVETLDENGNVVSSSRMYQERIDNTISTFNLFDSYKSIAITNKSVLNVDRFEFNERFSDILSEAIVLDNRYLLSPEQKKLIDRYFSKAPDSTGLAINEDDIFTILADNDLVQLDKFLGEV